jgi:hypothetical protein
MIIIIIIIIPSMIIMAQHQHQVVVGRTMRVLATPRSPLLERSRPRPRQLRTAALLLVRLVPHAVAATAAAGAATTKATWTCSYRECPGRGEGGGVQGGGSGRSS